MLGVGDIEVDERSRWADWRDRVRARARLSASYEPLIFGLVCAGSLAFSAAFIWRAAFRIGGTRAFLLLDDAMISMRYADNLAQGDGLVWNAGGERVEGITNPLWTLWMALLHLLPASPFKQPLLVMLTSSLLLLAVLWVVRRLAQELAPADPAAAVTSVILAATFYPVVFWSLLGMEVGLLAWLLGVVLLSLVRLVARPADWRRRDTVVLALAVAAALVTRMDALVPLAAAGLAAAWCAPSGRRIGVAGQVALPAVAALAVMTAVRLMYYGEWLPNTYYLKTTGVAVAQRFEVGSGLLLVTLVAHLAALVLAIGFGAHRPEGLVAGARITLTALVAPAAYSVWVGGDAWEYLLVANRYLSAVVVPGAVLAGAGVVRVGRHPRRLAGFCGVVAAVVAVGVLAGREVFAHSHWSQGSSVDITGDFLRRELDDWWHWYLGLAAGLAVVSLVLLVGRAKSTERGPIGQLGRFGRLHLGRRRSASTGLRPSGRLGVVLALLLVVGLTNGRGLTMWWHRASDVSGVEYEFARHGWAIRQASAPDTVIAVWQAGAEPYFADRPAVDLAGKSDEHVARLPVPRSDAFRAGHNKQDFRWSITTYRPDLVRSWLADPADERWLARQGYEPLLPGLWVRSSSERVDVDALRQLIAAF